MDFLSLSISVLGFAGGASGKEPGCQCRRLRLDLWVGKIPWRRKWQPTPIFLPGNPIGQRDLMGYSPWGHRVRYDLATEQKAGLPIKMPLERWVPLPSACFGAGTYWPCDFRKSLCTWMASSVKWATVRVNDVMHVSHLPEWPGTFAKLPLESLIQ